MAIERAEESYAIKYANHLERRARHWCILRWLLLCGSLVIMGLGGLWGHYLRMNDIEFSSSLETLSSVPSADEIRQIAICGRIEGLILTMCVIVSLVGILMFIGAVINWNRAKKDMLLAGLVRAQIESQQ